jgi:hypothetical protein
MILQSHPSHQNARPSSINQKIPTQTLPISIGHVYVLCIRKIMGEKLVY